MPSSFFVIGGIFAYIWVAVMQFLLPFPQDVLMKYDIGTTTASRRIHPLYRRIQIKRIGLQPRIRFSNNIPIINIGINDFNCQIFILA